jgi:hypothetical protein
MRARIRHHVPMGTRPLVSTPEPMAKSLQVTPVESTPEPDANTSAGGRFTWRQGATR